MAQRIQGRQWVKLTTRESVDGKSSRNVFQGRKSRHSGASNVVFDGAPKCLAALGVDGGGGHVCDGGVGRDTLHCTSDSLVYCRAEPRRRQVRIRGAGDFPCDAA